MTQNSPKKRPPISRWLVRQRGKPSHPNLAPPSLMLCSTLFGATLSFANPYETTTVIKADLDLQTSVQSVSGDNTSSDNTSSNNTPTQNSQTTASQLPQPTIEPPALENQATQPTTEQPTTHNPQPTTNPKNTQSQTAQNSLNALTKLYQPNQQGRYCTGSWVIPQSMTKLPPTGSYAAADYGYYDNVNYAELAGDVLLSHNGRTVFANKATLNTQTDTIYADGQVLFTDNNNTLGLIGAAKSIQLNKQQAFVQDLAFASVQTNVHGHAKTLDSQQNKHSLTDVMFSTCPPNDRKWHIDATSIEINQDTGRAVAKNAALTVKGLPILYLPYFDFPIDNRRKTGFLLPKAGFNSNDGLYVGIPYYVNLAPNYDMTLTPTLYTKRNLRLQGEWRYLTADFGAGRLEVGFLPNDKKHANRHRSHVFFDHHWQSTKNTNLTGYATYRHVSDNAYLSDFDQLGLANNPINLPRRLGISYTDDHVQADLYAETFQTLKTDDPSGNRLLDKHKPYSRLPQLSAQYTLPSHLLGQWQAFNIQGVSQSAYFQKSIKDGSEVEKSGIRLYNQLSISKPINRFWGNITPKFSVSHLYTQYNKDSQLAQNIGKDHASTSVFVPQLSIDSNLILQKNTAPQFWQSSGGYQLLNLRLKYLYAPHKNQNNMPNFETVLAPMMYDQLLADSWFLGYDRISDMHAITPAINYRYIDKQGQTRIDASIAQQFYLNNSQVQLDGQRLTGTQSGLAWRGNIQPTDNLWLDTSGSLNQHHQPDAFIGQIRYMPSTNQLYSIGIAKRQENKTLGQAAFLGIHAAGVVPINPNWQLVGQLQYNHRYHKATDTLIGLNYEDCCIGVSVYGREYHNDLTPNQKPDRAIMAELRLAGLTQSGSLFRLLRSKVLGFDNLSY